MKTVDLITFVLIIFGALNWGLVGVFQFDLVAAAFGPLHIASRVVYVLIGVSALYHAIAFKAIHQRWRPRSSRMI